jgi:hypothetical protein
MTIDKEALEKRTTNIDIAEDIRFRSNQYIQFPSTIGVSGECHKKMLHKYQNNFGVFGRKYESQESYDSKD